jgi:methylglyoxal synthase
MTSSSSKYRVALIAHDGKKETIINLCSQPEIFSFLKDRCSLYGT